MDPLGLAGGGLDGLLHHDTERRVVDLLRRLLGLLEGLARLGDRGEELLDRLKGNTALKEAEADFGAKVKEFFAPVVEASEAFEQAKKAALTVNDPAFRVVVQEAIEATAGQTERVSIVQRDTAILRLIESGDTSRLLWVNGAIEITAL